MSCRETKGGTIALRLARLYSGLPDQHIQKLFHALQREGKGLPYPTENDRKRWHARQRALLRHADISEAVRTRSERDLFLAKAEIPDGPLFHALSRIELRARQEAILQNITTAVDLDPPGSQAANYDLGEDGRPKKVWYASYGSNMSRQRFLTYIEGGKPEGSSTTHYGARNETPPTGDIPIRFDGRMHFAYSSTRWGNGGVAFMDVDHAGHALGRAYQITVEQFDDVVAQENGRYVLGGKDLITPLDKVIQTGREEISRNLYGTLIHVGDYQACPVFTFTGAFTAQQALEESALYYSSGKADLTSAANKPSGNYLRMIAKGLEESFNMTEEEQVDYLRGCGGAEDWTRRELLAVLRAPEPEPLPPVKSYSGYGTSPSAYTSTSTPTFKEPTTTPPYTQPPLFPGVRMAPKDASSPPVPVADWRTYSQKGRIISTPGPGTPTPTQETPTTPPPVVHGTRKPCPACGKTDHTMHDCPELVPATSARTSTKKKKNNRRRNAKRNTTATTSRTIILPTEADREEAKRQILLELMGEKKISRAAARKLLEDDPTLQADLTAYATALAVERDKRKRSKKTTTSTTTATSSTRPAKEEDVSTAEWRQAEALYIDQLVRERNISRQAAWNIVKKDFDTVAGIAQHLRNSASLTPIPLHERISPPQTKEETFAAGGTQQEWDEAERTFTLRFTRPVDVDKKERTIALLVWSAAHREKEQRRAAAQKRNTAVTLKNGNTIDLHPHIGQTVTIQARFSRTDSRTYTGTLLGLAEPTQDTPHPTRFIILQGPDGKTSHLNPRIIDTIKKEGTDGTPAEKLP